MQFADAPPDIGADFHLSQLLDENRRSRLRVESHGQVFHIRDGSKVSPTSHHVLPPGKLDEAPLHVVVSPADRFHHFLQRDSVGGQGSGVQIHLVLPDEAADGGDLRHTGNGLQFVSQIPILKGTELGEVMGARGVHEGVLVNPANGRRVLCRFHFHPTGETGQNVAQGFDNPGAGPVDVRAVFKDEVYERIAEVGKSPDISDPGHSQQGLDDGVRHLVFHDVGAAVPPGINDDLGVGKVGYGVESDILHGIEARQEGQADKNENDEPISGANFNDLVNHWMWLLAASMDTPAVTFLLSRASPAAFRAAPGRLRPQEPCDMECVFS